MARRKRTTGVARKTTRKTEVSARANGNPKDCHLTYTEQMSIVIAMISATGVTVTFWALSLQIV